MLALILIILNIVFSYVVDFHPYWAKINICLMIFAYMFAFIAKLAVNEVDVLAHHVGKQVFTAYTALKGISGLFVLGTIISTLPIIFLFLFKG